LIETPTHDEWDMGSLGGRLALFQPTANRLRDRCAYKAYARRCHGLSLKCWHYSQFDCEQKGFFYAGFKWQNQLRQMGVQ
ncbi:TPA: hypothetical protein ACRZ2Q_005548, partial [Vibrio harveyi]